MFADLLKDKNILVGVTGSIAIYKSLELIRLYVKAGANVKIVMSESAKKFITPLTFEALTQNTVLHSDTESWANENNHIDIGKWADIFVIAPATAHTINSLNNGLGDNLLLQSVLAYDKIKLIAPAANTRMYLNAITQASLKMLKLINFQVIEPQKKLLACNDEGIGAMADPVQIFYKSMQTLLKDTFWENRRVVISGGGTIEKIDDVRFISNFSSGKMANNLAMALYFKGADVCMVTTKPTTDIAQEIYTIDVESSQEMSEYLADAIRVAKKGVLTKPTLMDDSVPELIQKKPFLFMAAAVSDYIPKFPQSGKMKKEMIGDNWQLELKKNIDILNSLNKNEIFSVGFKAETDESKGFENAKNMLLTKNIDAVCLNFVNKNGFGSDMNEINLITQNSEHKISKDTKLNISIKLLELLKQYSE